MWMSPYHSNNFATALVKVVSPEAKNHSVVLYLRL